MLGSRSNKIYLLLWGILISITVLGVVIIPRVLDGSQESGYHELEGQNIANLADPSVTRFPVRPILDDDPVEETPQRQAFPELSSADASPSSVERLDSNVGLPQRSRAGAREERRPTPVTSRVKVIRDASVYAKALTTAEVIGTVKVGLWVRWIRTIDAQWEEIMLNDERLVYLPKGTLALPGSSDDSRSGSSLEPDFSELPNAVSDFMAQLRRADIARAETYLSASAPSLTGSNLDAWKELLGPEAKPVVGRLQPPPDGSLSVRVVEITDVGKGIALETVWEWNSRAGRWLLGSWR